MNNSTRKGFSFGLTSGVITTLGLMVGLDATTSSKLAVAGGIVSIAFADAFSDALGMHISEESQKKSKIKGIWQTTMATFFAKFLFALTFLLPVILFKLETAILFSIGYGLGLIAWLSYSMAKSKKQNPSSVIKEHLSIAVLVIIITYIVGKLVAYFFL